jgi:Transglutaminase-like superfamily
MSRLFRLFVLGACLCLSIGQNVRAEQALRKIIFDDTGNYLLSQQYAYLLLPESLSAAEPTALRNYTHDLVASAPADEWQRVLRSVAWVHHHIQHDSFNQTLQTSSLQILQRAQQGERFSCVEYAKVLRDSLNMQGIVARSIGLQSTKIAYGSLGSSHVAVEAWSNSYSKWVLLDAQFGVYPFFDHKPLNARELYQLQRQGKLKHVVFKPVEGIFDQELNQEYHQFIGHYLGYMSFRIRSDAGILNLVMPLAGKTLPLTFQGLPKSSQLFTRNTQDVYFSLNQTHAILHFADHQRAYEQFSRIEIKDDADYVKQMSEFAPAGQLIVELDHNMPWFDHFEVRVEKSPWRSLEANRIDWDLQPGKNRMQVRAVNSAGIKGPLTNLQLLYE